MKSIPYRQNYKDIWNLGMIKDAELFDGIPKSKSTDQIPVDLISYKDALTIHKKQIRNNNKKYHINAFIHFYIDDCYFDGPEGIWNYPKKFISILKHFDGCIAPDFSTYEDFPDEISNYNHFRMYMFAYYLIKLGFNVIHNLRWDVNSMKYCLNGIEQQSIVCIGTVASNLRNPINRTKFHIGLLHIIDLIKPGAIIVYGSSNYSVFDLLKHLGYRIITFESQKNKILRSKKYE